MRSFLFVSLLVFICCNSGCWKKIFNSELKVHSKNAEDTNLSNEEAQVQSNNISVIVDYCYDGDTCKVRLNGEYWFNVRLAGIDAPEMRTRKKKIPQPYAQEAKDFINRLIQGKQVKLIQSDLDAFNRPIVEIFSEDKLVNILLIEEGLAEAYKGKTKRIDKQIYLEAEAKVKKEKKGIWALADYVSPKDYRTQTRKQKIRPKQR